MSFLGPFVKVRHLKPIDDVQHARHMAAALADSPFDRLGGYRAAYNCCSAGKLDTEGVHS